MLRDGCTWPASQSRERHEHTSRYDGETLAHAGPDITHIHQAGCPLQLGRTPPAGAPLLALGPPRLRLGPGEVGDRLAGRESLPRCWVLSLVTWRGSVTRQARGWLRGGSCLLIDTADQLPLAMGGLLSPLGPIIPSSAMHRLGAGSQELPRFENLPGVRLMNLSKLWERVENRGAWRTAVPRVSESRTRVSN